jgi:pyruvate kinase
MLDVASWTQALVTGLPAPKEVAFGERLVLSPTAMPNTIAIKTDIWDRLFAVDAKVFIGSGNVALRTVAVHKDRVELEVTQGGTIYPDMDVIIPETRRDPDRQGASVQELDELIGEGIDYLIIPGQWKAATIAEFRASLVKAHGDGAPWLIVKIDSEGVYERLAELVKDVDGVLISRREMALTMNPSTVPMITKEIIQFCADAAKVVITASEMLASMRRNSTPTRGEVSDVANAVIDGTDAVMLSEEVANGRYGDKSAEVMGRIIRDIESAAVTVRPNWLRHAPKVTNEMDAIAYNALKTAERLKAKAIVTITKAGNTAMKLASFRAPVPIIAVTFSEAVLRRLAIVRGVQSLLVDIDPNLDEVLPLVNDQLVRYSWLKPGDNVIFVAITLSPVGRESSNLLTVQTLT